MNKNIYFLGSPIFIQQGVGDKKFGDKKTTTAEIATALQAIIWKSILFLKILCFLSLRFCCPPPNNFLGGDFFGTKNN